MDIEVDRERIVNKFKRNGHYLNKSSLTLIQQHLKGISNQHKRLDEIIQKINEMIVMNQEEFNDGTLKLAIELLNHTSKNGHTFNTYDKFLEHLKKWTIYYVSPYQTIQRFFVDKPDPSLFKFQPADFLEMNNNRFKALRDYNYNKNKNSQNYIFMGVLYEKYVGQSNRIMLQNQINEVQLIFPLQFNLQCFLIPGCTYIAQGQFKSKDIQLFVKKIELPEPLPKNKQNIFHSKLKLVCDTISTSKSGLNFSVQDFKAYQLIYNKDQNKKRPILVFGNVRVNLMQIEKIKRVMEKYPERIQCIILMISEGEHEQIDLTKYLSETTPIFIIPNINSEGPRILPKPPIIKNDYRAKVLTNPARLSIQGKQCIFLNYPLLKNLQQKNLVPKQKIKINHSEKSRMAANMLYSQNNVALTNKCFWKQSSYFNVSSQDFIFINDKVFCQQYHTNAKGGALTNVGNFQREGEFVFFMPHANSKIQLCDNKIL